MPEKILTALVLRLLLLRCRWGRWCQRDMTESGTRYEERDLQQR